MTQQWWASSAYREEVNQLVIWCDNNNLSLNVSKTKEVTVDFRRKLTVHNPLKITGSTVLELVRSTKFLGVHIAEDLSCATNTTSLVKRAQQHQHFLKQMRTANLPPPVLITFYRGTIEDLPPIYTGTVALS